MNAHPRPSRPRREGWPWPAPTGDANARETAQNADELASADALVAATALSVAQLTEELRLALRRLDEAQREARLVAECAAAREAIRLITRARQADE